MAERQKKRWSGGWEDRGTLKRKREELLEKTDNKNIQS
jgi:hypothetical protein